MLLFVHDKPVKFKAASEEIKKDEYHFVLHHVNTVSQMYLDGKLLVVGASNETIYNFLKEVEGKKVKKLKSITFVVEDINEAIQAFKENFKIVRAAGGVVQKNDQVLLIYRLGKWDLPKGKFEKGETPEQCAVREVEEECAIKVAIDNPLTTTYHTYVRAKKWVLKKTYWYTMHCIGDEDMKPQKEEGIEELKWMTPNEVNYAMKKSYKSIAAVMKAYYNL